MTRPGRIQFNEMPSGELIRYLVDIQHPYLKKALSTFGLCGKSIGDATSSAEVIDVIQQITERMTGHLEQDEKDFFVRLLRFNTDRPVVNLPKLLDEIREAHAEIKVLLAKLRTLTNHYTAPEGASATINLCYAQLFNFEQDFFKHILLEEDILFPKLLAYNKQRLYRHGKYES